MEVLRRAVNSFPIFSVRPTLVGSVLVEFLSCLRFSLLTGPFIELHYVEFPILHVFPVLIGTTIAYECGCSILSFIYRLQFRKLLPINRPRINFWSLRVFTLFGWSVANVIWLFMQVRQHWTHRLSGAIQILHLVPSSLLAVQAILQGTYFCFWKWSDVIPQRNVEKKRKHIQSQIDLNVTLLMYSLTTGLAMAYMHDHTVNIVASAVYLVGEVVHRLYSIRHLRKLKYQYILHEQWVPRHDVESEDGDDAVTSSDEIFQNCRQNKHYDARKEELVQRCFDKLRRFE